MHHVDQGRARAPDHLRLRAPGERRAARGPAAAGAARRTPIEAYSLTVSPKNHFLNWQQDPFGNWLARLVFPEKVSELEITVGLVADLMVINPFDFFVEEYAERFPFAYEPSLAADLAPYLRPVDDSDAAAGWREALPPLPDDGMPIVSFLSELNAAVNRDVAYSVRMEAGVQTPDETLRRGIGSCRDSAWLLVSLLRQYGLAARFVSGYLVQLAADPDSMVGLDGPTGTAQDFTDLHAWAEVFVPGAGWVGLDPTSALFAGEGHIPLSATPHPSAAAPIEGATDPVEVTFSFHNEVRRVHEDPRVTKPYTDDQWARIDALGEAVDERLRAGDVRLTMGGEPTFVSRDDATTPQWNTDADGPEKRALANELAERLRETYAVGGVVHRGQGKWYPGEPLPRWNIALQWRTDGVPLWQDPALFADPWSGRGRPGRGRRRRGAGPPGHPAPRPAARAAAPGLRGPARRARRRGAQPGRRAAPTSARGRRRGARRRRHRAARLGAAARHRRGRLDEPRLAVPPRPPGADAGHVAGRAAAAAGLDLVGGPGVRRRAVVPRGRPAAAPDRPPGPARRPRGRPDHRADLRGPRRPRARLPAADRAARGLRRPAPAGRGRHPPARLPGRARGLRPAAGPAADPARRHARPRRHRGQRAADRELGRAARPDHDAVRRGAAQRADDREVRPRRAAHRHRRRQPHHPRRHRAGRLAAAAPARPAGQPDHLLAAAPVAVLPLLRALHRPDQPGAALRRGPARGRLRDGDRLRRDRPAGRRAGRGRRRGPAVAGRPGAAAPAHRPDRQHPPRRVLHRQDVQPRLLARPARPAGAARLRDAAAPADGAGAGAAGAQPGGDVLGAAADRAAGALGHRAARGLPAAPGRDPRHRRGRRRPARASASRSRSPGSTRSPSSASRGSAWRPSATASSSSCARPSSRGTCSARRRPPAAPRATSTPRSSGSRCRSAGSTPRGTSSRARVCRCP